MMGDLENADLCRHKPWHDRALDIRPDVTRQQQRDVAIQDLENDRVIVADPLPLPVGRGWMMHNDASVAETELFAFVSLVDDGTG